MIVHGNVVFGDEVIDLLIYGDFQEIVTVSIVSDCSDNLTTEFLIVWLSGSWRISLCGGPSQFPPLDRSSGVPACSK